MEKLKSIYKKDIEREIQGVIKVDDENFIEQELDEYVVTNELLKHFKSFFEAYDLGVKGKTEKMGVWISGFFGSGKSHFLKMISYLLENKTVKGRSAVSYFEDKINDKELLNLIKEDTSISSDVILFNIDSKSGNSNGSKDKILEVFEKVFNEKMGLSTNPFVAEIERFLIKSNKYKEFIEEFNKHSFYSWEESRDSLQFVEDEFALSYSKVLGKSEEESRSIIERTENNYTVSVEEFAKRVNEYLSTKEDNHHIIFLVDEVGQYIGNDRNLMLNLQTIVEDLGIMCGGKAWVIVTSQGAIDDYVKVQGNDFSKIQGRFDTKLSLSSSDIDEVIKKRILEKTEEASKTLNTIYESKSSIIKNLLTFNSTSTQELYEDNNDFIATYPFIPYQFKLLQDVFTDIRKHGYSGKHLSSGERSTLGAFQQTAKEFKNNEIGTLIPFYAFYDTIEKFLEPQITRVINHANDLVKDDKLKYIDVNILKMLFMLKNIKEIPSNIDNLSTLYVSNIDDDKISLKDEINDSLRRLLKEVLIQRNNDIYKFLTDEEQEINREINQMDVDPSKLFEFIGNIIFSNIYLEPRVKYKDKPFDFSKYIDDFMISSFDSEIGLKIITDSSSDVSEIIMKSASEKNCVFVKLDLSGAIIDDIYSNLKYDQYKRVSYKSSINETVESILKIKDIECRNAYARIKDYIKEQLGESEIYVNGEKLNISSKDPKTRINEALITLIKDIYNKYSYIEGHFDKNAIRELFSNKQMSYDFDIETSYEKAYEVIKDYITEQNECRKPVTIRSLLQHFEKAPYGFNEDDVLYILTKLLKNEVVSFIYANELQSTLSEDTLNKIIKREYYEKTLIKLRIKIDTNLINNLRTVARDAFDDIDLPNDEDGMLQKFKKDLQDMLNKLNSKSAEYLVETKYPYPGKSIIDNYNSLITKIIKIKENLDVFTEVSNSKEEFNTLAPKVEEIFNFFNGPQKLCFDESKKTIEVFDNNVDFIDNNEEVTSTVKEIKDILTNEEPYSKIQELPLFREKLNNLLTSMYEEKAKPIIEEVKDTITYFENETENAGVDVSFADGYINTCKNMINALNTSNELRNIYAQKTRIEQFKETFDNALEYEKSKKDAINESGEVVEEKLKTRTIVRTENLIRRSYEINSKEDIDKFINELRDKLLKEFEKNNNLTIK